MDRLEFSKKTSWVDDLWAYEEIRLRYDIKNKKELDFVVGIAVRDKRINKLLNLYRAGLIKTKRSFGRHTEYV